jgi:hypothetical protein
VSGTTGTDPAMVYQQCSGDVDGNGNIKPSKRRSHERIDGVSALVRALARALLVQDSVYDEQGLLAVRLPMATGVPGAHPSPRPSVQRVYFFGGATLRSFVTLTTPSVSFASFSASAFACSFGTVPFR